MQKSRNQSLYDFLQCLQLEYVSAELRSKIYPSQNDKRYYKKVMSFKLDKIEDIAQRNGLPTIFNNQEEKQEVYAKTYTSFGLPQFSYKDENDQEKFEESDLLNYFCEGGEVKILQEDESLGFEVGIIVDNDKLKQVLNERISFESVPIVVKKRKDQNEIVVLTSQLSRIL